MHKFLLVYAPFRAKAVPIWMLVSCLACSSPNVETTDPFVHIEEEQARSIIRAAIEHAGGLEHWQAVQWLRYTKDFQLFTASGEVEKTFEQVHNYRWQPLHIEIASTENDTLLQTVLQNGQYSRTKDGQAVNATQEALAKAVNTSVYVVSMPFKLLDPGAAISYQGEDTLADGRIVDVVQVAYNAEQHSNHSTSDVWTYFFDKDGPKIVANWVKTGDHFSLIENLSYERVDGILFNKARKSYRTDSLRNKLYLRADYLYDNYEVEFIDSAPLVADE